MCSPVNSSIIYEALPLPHAHIHGSGQEASEHVMVKDITAGIFLNHNRGMLL